MTVSSDGILLQQNAYDGFGRRATELAAGIVRHFYYSTAWQDLEERVGKSQSSDTQFVWGLQYIDALLLRDSADYTPTRFYGLQDPNWNATSIVDSGGILSERYANAPYGQPVFLSSTFSVQSSSSFGWDRLFGGYRRDAATAMHCGRARYFMPLIGCWIQRDSSEFSSATELYRYAANNPISRRDPMGREAIGERGGEPKCNKDSFLIDWADGEVDSKKGAITKCCDAPKGAPECPTANEHNLPKASNCFTIVIWAPSYDYVNPRGDNSMIAGHGSFTFPGHDLCGFHGSGFMNDTIDMAEFGKHSTWECCCLSDLDMFILALKMHYIDSLMDNGSPWAMNPHETYPKTPADTFWRCFRGKPPYPTCFGQAAEFGAGLGCPALSSAAGRDGIVLINALKNNKYCRLKDVGANFCDAFKYKDRSR